MSYDLAVLAFEKSADLHGYELIKKLLIKNPNLKILTIAGPKIRTLKVDTLMYTENFQVMGFIDVFLNIFKLIKNFFLIRNTLLNLNPKAIVFLDYAEFNLKLEKSIRKKGFKNKLIHFISPTIWAWRKNRKYEMEKNLDLLLTIFPFEKKHFSDTHLKVEYIGHPLSYKIQNLQKQNFEKKYFGIFPGSRKAEISQNFPLQLFMAKELLKKDKNIKFAISNSNPTLIKKIFDSLNLNNLNFIFFDPKDNYTFMQKLSCAVAVSGTINLELALFNIPTVVNFAIKKLDLFIARKILKINLPYYCIVNILSNKEIYKELYGPNLTNQSLLDACTKLYFDEKHKQNQKKYLIEINNLLSSEDPSLKASEMILEEIF
jgi:lipid-A-disaccharide synthase